MNNSTARRNPYIIGRSIYEPEKFFGRDNLFKFIEDCLNSNTRILLLHGQRRIGTSSVLQQIPHKLAENKFVFINFDLQGHSQSSLSEILHKLSEAIAETLELKSDIISLPSQEELENHLDIFSNNFLPRVYQILGDRNLVILLDEFDVISSDDNILNHGNNFFRYLQSLLDQQEKLFIIPVVGRTQHDLQNLVDLFNTPPYQKVDLLDEITTKQLITKPAQGMLEYEEDAIRAIFELSSGHPYFTQAICFNLFLQAKIAKIWKVTRSDVEGIVDKTIESVEPGLVGFWYGLSVDEKVVFSAVAEGQKIAIEQSKSFPEDPLILLNKYGVIITIELREAAKKLIASGFLDETEHRVKIELVRRWLVENHPLKKAIWRLEKFREEEINRISEEAIKLHQDGKNQNVIDAYEEILKLNPNHFSTLAALAEKYLEIYNFKKSLEIYERAYQIDYIRNKEGFLLALEAYGNNLIKQRKFIEAKAPFQKVLKIEADRESAKYKLREIEAEIEQQEKLEKQQAQIYQQQLKEGLVTIESLQNQKALIRPVILGLILLGISIGSIVVYRFSTSCDEGQQKVDGSCGYKQNSLIPNNIQNNISRGDRTLFFSIPNTYRDQGIEAFKQGNYPQAIELFQQAITANRSDPEVRIYYNNAIARQRGNPFTLAVVVPAENGRDRSLEILRGVAQSQEQFNANGGRDNRLLEIVIANDGDDPKQAQQIAQQLANDKSVLGVIGHGSSTTTKAAFNIYEQTDIPVISPTSTANTLQGKDFFRTTPSDAASGEKLAKYAIDSRLNKVIVVYNSDNSYSKTLMEEFRINFKGQIISLIDLNNETLNIEQELKDSASKQVQGIVLFPSVQYTATTLDIAKANADNKLGLKLLGGDTLYNQKTLQDGGNAVEGLVVAVPWFRDAPQAKSFSQAARRLWGGDISWRTATSYDAAQAFINSLSAQPSRETILQKLPQTNLSAKLTSGNELKFQKGEHQSEAVLVKVESGKFTCLNKCLP
ncbi:ABC transporter substrate-binding protein [Nostoc punctiforme FACHB-252]|uniref:ABC transporter substrate-binding protein n=1 Tax=Nostoc punctiforme FACHB-252 TaxID=1357509 RepID=A0ABR8HI70_NOSPU|nr:ABC transporter substrate-binding protein [Nostoc punctiforme]MBD2615551.1 ABC transporter substrate-binding protein [Nostoc punctiforme FACHB-252]